MLSQYLNVVFLILYSNSVYVTCQGSSSLVYVIDHTLSMGDDIKQVKIGSELILNNVLKAKSSEIANIVLVTFHDPDVDLINITNDPNKFKKALSSIKLESRNHKGNYNYDCDEYSMSGMIGGLNNSLPNSYMYVFTDAAAKDHYKVGQVIDLCMKKQTQIFIIATFAHNCYNYPNSKFKGYYDIANKCNGQVIFIDKKDVNKFISGFPVSDPKSVVFRRTIPKRDLGRPIQFNLDDRVDYATVFLSGTNDVDLEVGRNNFKGKIKTMRQMWTNNAKMLKVFNTVPGIYEAKVRGSSDVTITVYAKSDFIFKHGFTESQPKSFVDASTRPIAGEKQHLEISVTDPDHEVTIEQINILSTKEETLMTIPLKHIDGDFYITDKFMSPNSPFIIQVKGTSKQTGTTVLRNSRTVIEPIPAEKPVICANGDKIRVPEKHAAKISCRVSKGIPRPTITWKFQKNGQSRDLILLTESTEDLIIKEVTPADAGKYICIATNTLGSGQAKTELEVTKVPKVSIQEKSKILVEYGSTHEFICKVVAHPQPRIVWKDQLGNVLNSPQVTKNGYEFTSHLTVPNIRNPSQYTCYAENDIGNNSQAVSVSPRSAFDVVSKFEETTKVKYGKPVKLVCDIKSALPIERVWFSDKERELLLKGISKTKNAKEFVINFMDINLEGRYGCKVWLKSDPKVLIEQYTTLVIDDLSPPLITATQDISNKIFTATCLTKGTPKPTISWYYATDKNGPFRNLEVTGEEFKIHNIKLKHTGFYKCIAKNAVAIHEECINLVVEEPPQINADKTKYLALVGDSILKIPCNVTGYPDPTIVWKNNDNEIITTDFKYEVKKILNILNLVIKNPSVKDTNSFICEASNNLGNESKTFEIFVTDNIHNEKNFYGDTHTIYILENDTNDIKCNLSHLNNKSVRWYKNGLLTNVVGTYYTIKKASVLDDGNYTCRVNKEDGSMSETYAVDVGTRPIFNIDYDSSILFWSGNDNDFVDCSLKHLKPLDQHHTKVEWSYNGKKTAVKGYKHHALRWGQYSCKVSNVFGSSERSINVTTDGCLIRRKVDINDNPPLILSFNVNFESMPSMEVVSKYVFMEMEQTMLISCHNSRDKNHFSISDEQYLRAQCLGEDKFIINENVYNYSDLKCVKPVEVTIDSTKRLCTHDRSELIEVGFNIESGGFIEKYRVCFDNELNVPIFTYTEMAHSILGNEVDYKKWVNIPNYQGVRNTNCDNESKCCYGKGQLVNAVDVDFGPPQAATFYDYNAVGVWKPCENESRISWGLIEEKVRNLIESHYSFQVWSGTSEYEHQSVGMVPRYLWKVIDSYGVIVYVNNPKPTVKDIKCSSSINNHTILNRLVNPEDPFTYLCEIEEFYKQFNILRDSLVYLGY